MSRVFDDLVSKLHRMVGKMAFNSRNIWVNGIRTHFLEAGDAKETLVMLHSAEFSGSAEFSWKYNIDALATKFHVYCPDMVGFGKTEKVFDFENPNGFRLGQLRAWMDALGIGKAHFMGCSWSANQLLSVAASHSNIFEIDRIVAVSGGYGPNMDVRKALTAYVPTKENMKSLLKILFNNEKWFTDPYLENRYRASIDVGAWEAVAAARFGPPGQEKPWKGIGASVDYSRIEKDLLLVGGSMDELAPPEAIKEIHTKTKNSEMHIFPDSKHCPQIECSQEFNELAISFLSR